MTHVFIAKTIETKTIFQIFVSAIDHIQYNFFFHIFFLPINVNYFYSPFFLTIIVYNKTLVSEFPSTLFVFDIQMSDYIFSVSSYGIWNSLNSKLSGLWKTMFFYKPMMEDRSPLFRCIRVEWSPS